MSPVKSIIPLQEKTGNYNSLPSEEEEEAIIPLQEKTGNYNGWGR